MLAIGRAARAEQIPFERSTAETEAKVNASGCMLYRRGNMPPREKRLRTPGERARVVNVLDEGSLDVEGVVLE